MFGGRQTVSFHARTARDGSVTGTFQSKSRGQGTVVHADLDCLVVNGDEAILGGVFTRTRVDPDQGYAIPPGERVWFKVRDLGEGAIVPRDEFSDWYFGGYVTITRCAPNPIDEFPDLIPELYPIEVGNIQVKP